MSVVQDILSATSDGRVRLAMLMGSHMEGGWGPTFSPGDFGTSFGPFQIHLPAHPGVTSAEADNPSWATRYMLSSYENAVSQIPGSLWSSNPEQAGEEAAYLAERPAETYYQSQGPGAVNAAFSAAKQALGNPGAFSGGGSATTTSASTSAFSLNPIDWVQEIIDMIPPLFNASDWIDLVERFGLIVLGGLLFLIGLFILAEKDVLKLTSNSPEAQAVLGNASNSQGKTNQKEHGTGVREAEG